MAERRGPLSRERGSQEREPIAHYVFRLARKEDSPIISADEPRKQLKVFLFDREHRNLLKDKIITLLIYIRAKNPHILSNSFTQLERQNPYRIRVSR